VRQIICNEKGRHHK